MIERHETISDFPCLKDLNVPDFEDSLFFDIETTGLTPAHSYIFIIGAVYLSDGKWTFSQWMSELPAEEHLIIERFLELASSYCHLIHFNGTTFDLPFVKKRASILKLPYALDQKNSFDLYQKLKFLRRFYPGDNLKQKTLEIRCGYFRQDQLSGKEIIKLYQRYVGLKEPDVADLLLGHNHDDLSGMIRILPLLSLSRLLDGTVRAEEFSFSDKEQTLSCTFEIPGNLPDSLVFCSDIVLPSGTVSLAVTGNLGSIVIPAVHTELKHFFPDYKNYFYLPYEDQAIHKSVGAFLDKEFRRQAKADTCYIKKAALFLPQAAPVIQPSFKENLKDDLSFFEWNESVFETKKQQEAYLAALLPYLLNCLN